MVPTNLVNKSCFIVSFSSRFNAKVSYAAVNNYLLLQQQQHVLHICFIEIIKPPESCVNLFWPHYLLPVSSCVQVEEHHAVDIDVYHCPNCDVVQGPSLSEYCYLSLVACFLCFLSTSLPLSLSPNMCLIHQTLFSALNLNVYPSFHSVFPLPPLSLYVGLVPGEKGHSLQCCSSLIFFLLRGVVG